MSEFYGCTLVEALNYVLENCDINKVGAWDALKRHKDSIESANKLKRQRTIYKHKRIKNEILEILPEEGKGLRPYEIGIKLGYTTSQITYILSNMKDEDKTIILQSSKTYNSIAYYRKKKDDEEWVPFEEFSDNSEIAEKILEILPDCGKGLRPGEVGIQAGVSTSKAYYVLNALVEQKGVIEVRYHGFSRYRKLAKGESWVPMKYASKI